MNLTNTSFIGAIWVSMTMLACCWHSMCRSDLYCRKAVLTFKCHFNISRGLKKYGLSSMALKCMFLCRPWHIICTNDMAYQNISTCCRASPWLTLCPTSEKVYPPLRPSGFASLTVVDITNQRRPCDAVLLAALGYGKSGGGKKLVRKSVAKWK